MPTATVIINGAMRKLALIASGEAASANELTDALECLNDMINAWSVEEIVMPYTVAESFSLVSGTGTYSIGSGGAFDTVRPIDIKHAFIRDTNDYDYLLTIQTVAQYNNKHVKTALNRPTMLYYRPTYPLGLIYFDYLPSTVETLYIESIKHLTNFSDLVTSIDILPELKSALIYNLAIELAPEFGAQPSSVVNIRAHTTLSNLRSAGLAKLLNPIILNLPVSYEASYNINNG